MFRARGPLLTVAGTAVVVLALSACPKGSSGPKGTAEVRLNNVPDGVGTLSIDAAQVVSLAVDAWGFGPSSKHAVHVHPGTCLDPQNPPIITLPELTADGEGRLKTAVRTAAPVSGGIPKGTRLDIHGEGATPIICTDLGDDPTVVKRLYPQPSEKPFGTVTVSHASGKVTLAFKLNALHGSTRHAVQIRTGSCKALDKVKYEVDTIRADRNGAANVSRTISNPGAVPRADWTVVVHEGAEPSSRPLLCGDIGALRASE